MGSRIYDVAEAAGVSIATVSRVLSQSRRVKPGNVARVREAAKRLGYYPHGPARALVSGRRETIGICWGAGVSIPDECARAVMDGVAVHLSEHNISNLMVFTPTSPGAVPKMLAERHIDGLILATHWNDTFFSLAGELGIPVVLAGESSPKVSCVYVDDRKVAREATSFLLELGHRSIAYVGTPCENPHSSVPSRFEGYLDALRLAGLVPSSLCSMRVPADASRSADESDLAELRFGCCLAALDTRLRALLDAPEPPTAFLCFDDSVAAWVIQVLRRMELRVPEDASVMGFNDAPHSHMLPAPLTTMEIPFREMGVRAVDLLMGAIEDPDAPRSECVLSATLKVRQSTTPFEGARSGRSGPAACAGYAGLPFPSPLPISLLRSPSKGGDALR
ncbi:MAG: LacI family DNA-binding transcriptional regulator [Planctomycetota bacterium]